ncbi:MAG: hypothetical protein QM811_22605 [Pirellulales bacterium]
MPVAYTQQPKEIYSRLVAVGMPAAFVKNYALPDWWDDSAATDEAAITQFCMFISRHLGFNLGSLFGTLEDSRTPVTFEEPSACKFKKQSGRTNNDVRIASAIASSAAELTACATTAAYTPLPSAKDIRESILNDGNRWIGLDELLNYCWSIGVPVIHVSHFPRTAKKMDGMVVMTDSRPVIVISKNAKYSAWLLFVLAHEIGHIALGHVHRARYSSTKRSGEIPPTMKKLPPTNLRFNFYPAIARIVHHTVGQRLRYWHIMRWTLPANSKSIRGILS